MAEQKKPKTDAERLAEFQKRTVEGLKEFDDSNSGGLYVKFLKYMAETFPGAFEEKPKEKKNGQ